MNNWLYPLSGAADRLFDDADGNELTEDTSYESFVWMMRQPHTDDRWYLATNYRNVEAGDRVWCYYGVADGDKGVVGVGRIRAVINDDDSEIHDIVIAWDKGHTRSLIRNPVSATRVRKFISHPRSPVQNLDRHPTLVAELVRHAGFATVRRPARKKSR